MFLHPLKGHRNGQWAMTVSGNWRITFAFDGEDVLPALKMTQKDFADWIGVSRLSVSELVNEKRTVTPDMAMRLGKALGNGPKIWLRMQQTLDLWELGQRDTYHSIKTLELV